MGLQQRACSMLLLMAAAASGYHFTDEQYYKMPRLFHLDDYEECLSSSLGVFCLGSFDLLQLSNQRLMQDIQKFSEDKYHFNHRRIHRGLCISTRCAQIRARSPRSRFERCVNSTTAAEYGLQTNLTRFEYCNTAVLHPASASAGASASASASARPLDHLDIGFAWICGAIFLINMIGTAYDVFRDTRVKPNKFLMTWSLCVNWRRLTADYTEGVRAAAADPRLSALKPVQGMKALTLVLIMLAHSVLAYHITYIYDPLFFEKSSHHPMSAYFQNGTSIVQTFIMASSFLLAYNLLLHSESSKRPLTLKMLPQCLLHRITRISPVYLFVLGMAVTWWPHAGDGPMWGPLVGGECDRCRDKWWTQALFINNLLRPDVKCLIHTWFLAVDMQLYIVSTVLTLALGRRPWLAIKVLVALLAFSVASNLAAAYYFELKPMVTLMFPEYMRTQFEGEASFTWLYQAPWDSLPAALVGLIVAFLHYQLQADGYVPADSLSIRVVYRASVPGMFLWVLGGHCMKGASQPARVALYAALDRPVFISMTAFAMYGFFNKIDSLWWRFLSWRGWEILGRMSLSIYLVHWLYALTQLAVRSHLAPVSVQDIGGHFLWTVFLSYWSALPLHLFIELPMQKFLQSIF